jgi:hypothetical protein
MSRQAIVAVCSVLTALALDDEAALQARLWWTRGLEIAPRAPNRV